MEWKEEVKRRTEKEREIKKIVHHFQVCCHTVCLIDCLHTFLESW